MVFTKRLREGIRRGRIKCSVRIWMRPHVKAGGRYRMDEGHIVVDSIAPIRLRDLTDDLAQESGFSSVKDLLETAKHGGGDNVYLIRFHYLPPGGWDVQRTSGSLPMKPKDALPPAVARLLETIPPDVRVLVTHVRRLPSRLPPHTDMGEPTIRERFLDETAAFVRAAGAIPGVRRIAVIGSIITDKPDPKDIDLLVTVTDDAELAPLAGCARRLQGKLQASNHNADVFLLDERGRYLGRTCRWRDCRPGVRLACDALHCGRRPYLHDDLEAITLDAETIAAARVQVWPRVERVGPLPADVERFLAAITI